MPSERELGIHTIIVDGDHDSLKAAFTRSVLGVTYKKFRRKGKEFYQNQIHNNAVTQRIYEWMYEFFLAKTPLKNLSDFKIKTDLTLKWDQTGRILGISDVKASVYLKVGELKIEELQVYKLHDKIKIDFFYSNIDLASEKVKRELLNVRESMGKENFEYSEINFLSENGRKDAQIFHVERVPTVIINDKRLENPDGDKLRAEIELAFIPQIKSTKAEFLLESTTKPTVEALATVFRN